MAIRNLQIGADPEVFVGENGKVRSIIDKIGGTKDFPLPLLTLGKGFAVQEDNVALEFNIPASGSRRAFVKNIARAREFLESLVRDQYNYSFVKESAVSFPDEELSDYRSWVFGCEPDYNAWTMAMNPKPAAADKNLRSCGGHVHVGYPDLENHHKLEAVRLMDLYLSVPAVLMDKGELRKQLYGKAGAFRDKPYGFEYRPLSNFWIFDNKTVDWVYRQTERAMDALLKGESASSEKDNILAAVDGNNKDMARELCAKYGLEVLNA